MTRYSGFLPAISTEPLIPSALSGGICVQSLRCATHGAPGSSGLGWLLSAGDTQAMGSAVIVIGLFTHALHQLSDSMRSRHQPLHSLLLLIRHQGAAECYC